MINRLSPEEVEKRIKAWADVTMLSLEIKLAALKKHHPELSENELKQLMQKDLSWRKTK